MIKLLPPKFWSKKKFISYLLLPFSFSYIFFVKLRRLYYRYFTNNRLLVPVIVVGNITVGGTGKTPLVIYLVNLLKAKGYKPGVISRGYGRKSGGDPIIVDVGSDVDDVGDEVLLIARRTECPIVVDINRFRAAQELFESFKCDVIISDDGLQHYRLPRYIEIALFDSKFRFGNGFCLPAGPLREPLARLKQVDFMVENFNTSLPTVVNDGKYAMVVEAVIFRNIQDQALTKTADDFRGKVVHAVAGIANPNKFFVTLRQLGLTIVVHPFSDHYRFSSLDFPFADEIVIMTEKDAVKCGTISGPNFWYLEIVARPSDNFVDDLLGKLKKF